MSRDLGVWTYEDCALVLIDYQKEMFEVIRTETDADLVELNVRLLARAAKAFDMPIVLSTVGVGYGLNGPTQPAILVIHWYFREVPQLTTEVGVAEAEKLAAQGAGAR